MKVRVLLFAALSSVLVFGCSLIGGTDERLSTLRAEGANVLETGMDGATVVDVDGILGTGLFPFGAMVSEMRTIKLETTSKSILGGIYKVIVTQEKIYVYDNFKGGGVVVFDGDGRFVKRLSYGRGPGELNRVWDVDYDHVRNELYVYQHPFLLVYDDCGNYLRDVRLPMGFYNFKIRDGRFVFKMLSVDGNGHLGNLARYSLFVADDSLNIVSAALPDMIEMGMADYSYLTWCGDELFVTQPFGDVVYKMDAEWNLTAEYLLEYDVHHLDVDALRKHRNNRESRREFLARNDGFYRMGRHLETKSHSLFFFESSNKGVCGIYRDKTSGAMRGGFVQDLPLSEMPPIAFPIATYGDFFVSVLAPYEYQTIAKGGLLSGRDIENISAMAEDDNPMLVLFKLKRM